MNARLTPLHGLQHDGDLLLAVGASRFEVKWQSKALRWSALLAKLAEPTRTPESCSEYDAASHARQLDLKDVGGYVGGLLKGGRRTAANLQNRQLITLDMDHGDRVVLENYLAWCDHAWALHSTRKDRPGKPRLRLLIPTARAMLPDEYQAIARRVAGDIGIELCDDTTFEPHRLMYWPSVSADQAYQFETGDAPWLDPDAVLARYVDWRDQRAWPTSSRLSQDMAGRAKRAGEPTTKPGLIGAFCRQYSPAQAIAEFLADVYTPAGEHRYTYAPGTSAGGVVVYEGKWVYSHHSTDPACGELCNAWDLVRLHKFGALDEDIGESKPVQDRPSSAEMRSWAAALPALSRQLAEEALAGAQGDFSPVGEGTPAPAKPDTAWAEALTRDRHGALQPTRENLRLVLTHDVRVAGKLAWDLFAQRAMAAGALPWDPSEGRREWRDVDDAGLRHFVEHHWKVSHSGVLADALALVQQQNAYHPVREYLTGLTWDGTERLDALLVRFLGAEDGAYTRAVTRKTLVAAVARVMTPGCKFDHMLTLYGAQKAGKSSFVRVLGGEWTSDSIYTVQGKEAYEALQGVWLAEMAELTATRRADVEGVKHFLSKTADRFRAAYGRHAGNYPRQCVFIGSTNEPEFLNDPTGNRRFWVVPVRATRGAFKWLPELAAERDQVWAEAVARWAEGETLYLDDALEAEANAMQEAHRQDDGLAARIAAWLDEPVPAGFPEWSLRRRLAALGGEFPVEGETVYRDRVCAREVWLECLGGREDAFHKGRAKEINDALRRVGWDSAGSSYRFGCYGRGRGFIRPGSSGKGESDVPF